jgi:hypothetical protein
MKTITAASYDYGMGLDLYRLDTDLYIGHYGEVANTSGLFYCHLQSNLAPNGYYISYNFNVQGADMINKLDIPVYDLLKSNLIGIKENNYKLSRIYPNPATDIVYLEMKDNSTNTILELTDLQGKLILQKTIFNGENKVEIPTNEFTKGIYFLKVVTEKNIELHKLIIE